MEYLFLFHHNEATSRSATPEENNRKRAEQWAVRDDAERAGLFRAAGPLRPLRESVTVRADGNNAPVMDGPFAETKEVLGGFYLLDCRDAAEAHYWATRMTCCGCASAIEYREVCPMPRPDAVKVTEPELVEASV